MNLLRPTIRCSAALLVLMTLSAHAQQTRMASDFEIAQMEKQLARERGFEARLSGRLNLGDLRAARNETRQARAEYANALAVAQKERLEARRDSSLSRYANATGYAALAEAKLGREGAAFALLEETLRYASDAPETWNLTASAMRILGQPRKAISAARNAVTAATTKHDALDLAVYQHALATALVDAGEHEEAERLLITVIDSLRSPAFEELRREVARQESFEIYDSARGDVAAFVSLLNRSQLRLAALYERRGDSARARAQYERVLEARSDDVTALAALARLASSHEEREQLYLQAFEANPFSMSLVRAYQRHLATAPAADDLRDDTPATQVRRALLQLHRGDARGARATLDALLRAFPDNETLRTLRREAEPRALTRLPAGQPSAAELRALLDGFEHLTAGQRDQLDRTSLQSVVRFEGQVFERGTIDGVPFRFSEPMLFAGELDIAQPLRLTYRVLGISRNERGDVLLLEPLRLESVP